MAKRKKNAVASGEVLATTTPEPGYEERDCPDCDGTGLAADGRLACRSCKGTGAQHRAKGESKWVAGRDPDREREQRRLDAQTERELAS